ncbi:MAG: hypothetical protein OEZ39_05700 [Gammaproteobacteria bacterium]|nr:hypothetical protein [Gammaproteobacteria bacterium]MDH5651349.1 hypothetical protein [Gammaproteobacteria bacterium]
MLNMLGVRLTLLIGPTVPIPAPAFISQNIDKIEVSQSDTERSGFQVTFKLGRSGPADLLDYQLLSNPLLKPSNRLIIMVTVNAIPRVIMDGIIENQQFNPGQEPGSSTVTITGQDISVMLDQKEETVEHPAQNEYIIALKLVAKYARYGLIPKLIPPFMIDFPLPVERIPVQRDTDLAYLKKMAARFGYVFYIDPGPLPGTNTAYWGPPIRLGLPKKALTLNMGSMTNVNSLDFQYDSESASTYHAEVMDRNLNTSLPVRTFFSTRLPPLAAFPAIPFDFPNIKDTELEDIGGLTYAQAFARAQAETNKSMDNVLTATGELDVTRYGDILEPRALVGVRGAGYAHDGFFYVKNLTHNISGSGEYKQNFTLTREGKGSTTPVVRV